jgi:hypothetical protein
VEAEVRSVPVLLPTARFISAAVAYSRGAIDEALVAATEAVRLLSEQPIEEWEELTHLTLIETLLAADQEAEANKALEAAFTKICDRARKITRAEHRHAYLERIPEVNRIVDLARDRLGKSLPFFAALPLKRPPTKQSSDAIPAVTVPPPTKQSSDSIHAVTAPTAPPKSDKPEK